MAISNFIPQIWSAQMLADFREQAIVAGLVNRDFEGEATTGNTVKINTAVNVAIKDYKTANRVTTADAVDSTSADLQINQEKAFDFYIDDIDRAQAAGSMDQFTLSAAEGLAEDADKFILATAVTGAVAGNITNNTVAMNTGDKAFNVLRDLRKTLNKQRVPLSNRVVMINAEFESVLLDAASKITAVDSSGDPMGLREATLGRLLGFTIVTTENLPVTAKPQAVAMYAPALAFVSAISNTEALRADQRFADRLRGLHVYGAKVIRPKAVAVYTDTSA